MAASESSYKVGIIAENLSDIHALRNLVIEAGLQVGASVEFSKWEPGKPLNADIKAWIVNLDVETLETRCPEKIDALMDKIPGVVILCEGATTPGIADPGYTSWKRRMMDKFHEITGHVNLESQREAAPERVWVLAGSIGGPDAIHKFLEALPPELGIAFVYANHLQKDFENVLASAMARNSHYPAYVPNHGDVLSTNKVAVISPVYMTTVKQNGTVQVSKQPWQGPYKPNLDHVVSSVAQTFGHTGGVIIFSGMCDDGAASCRIMKQNGGKVWTQKPDTCVSSAMPDAARLTGCVEKLGSPEELAMFLVHWTNEMNKQAAMR